MTREEILAMEPGRELDKLIDEKLFGREFKQFPMGDCYYVENNGWVSSDFYSTSISAAWEIVEHIKLVDDVDVAVIWHPKLEMYICNIGLISVAKYPTAPEAICKAALLGVMEE